MRTRHQVGWERNQGLCPDAESARCVWDLVDGPDQYVATRHSSSVMDHRAVLRAIERDVDIKDEDSLAGRNRPAVVARVVMGPLHRRLDCVGEHGMPLLHQRAEVGIQLGEGSAIVGSLDAARRSAEEPEEAAALVERGGRWDRDPIDGPAGERMGVPHVCGRVGNASTGVVGRFQEPGSWRSAFVPSGNAFAPNTP